MTPNDQDRLSLLQDYGNAGPHLVTVVTYQKLCWFDTRRFRRMAEEQWKKLIREFPTIRQDAFVVMPNHVHFIIWLYQGLDMFGDAPVEARVGRDLFAPDLAEMLRVYKDGIEDLINRSGGAGFAWERGFYDHQIGNREELIQARLLVNENPDHWDEDEENPTRA